MPDKPNTERPHRIELPNGYYWQDYDAGPKGYGAIRGDLGAFCECRREDAEKLAAAMAIAPSNNSLCPSCGGNDGDAPCAYPSEGENGCLRDKRLAAMAPQDGLREALEGCILAMDGMANSSNEDSETFARYYTKARHRAEDALAASPAAQQTNEKSNV